MKNLLPKPLKYPFVLKIKASAGAGKTYTLMLAFLWHLSQLQPELNNLKAIVALTFTNKATREMKTRILKGLKEVAKNSEQGQKLYQETGLTPLQAKKWLELILTNYNSFQVKTIDSFLFSLLTLLGIDQNWPKISKIELKEDFFLAKMIDNLLASKNQEKILQETFNTFLEIENPQGFYLQPKFKQRIIDLFKNSLEPVTLSSSPNLSKLKAELTQKSKQLLELIYQEESSIKFKYKWDTAFLNPIDNINSTAFSKHSLKELVSKKFQKFISPKLESIFTEIKNLREEYLLVLAKEKVKGYSKFLRLLHQKLQEYQKEQGVLIPSKWYLPLLQSLNKFDLPHLFCLLGEKWKHFLIDEFQDTSLIQWQLLKFFIENSISEGGSLILVGDSKQSIYIWRDAQPELFNEINSDFPQANFFEHNLPYNWRSLPNIINYNNTFFEDLFNNAEGIAKNLNGGKPLAEKIKAFYQDLTQKLAPTLSPSLQGKVESIYLTEPEDKETLLLDLLTKLSKTRPLKDIALLVRSNKEVNELTTLLWQHKLAAISENSLNLETSFVIRGLVNFLYFLNSPFTDMYLLGLLPLLNLPTPLDFDCYLKVPSDTPLFSWLKEENLNLYNCLKSYLSQAGLLSCYDLIQLFLEQENIWTRFSAHKPFINNFLELLLMTHSHCSPISSFLELWESQKKDQFVELPEQMEAIKVMTLHSAKGLEFPVVILPNVGWSPDRINLLNLPQIGLVRVKQPYPERILPYLEEEKAKKAIESLNLLYVGFTRAKEELYVFYQNSGVGKLLIKNV